ncbi:MAG: serine/threonine-protein kinase [Acidobacteria bacterium]|nr:serine/threonine-protein kinase [Acidobacteriota bacterium]
MTTVNWARLRDLFDQAVALPTGQRAELLAGVPEESLRLQVESLLNADAGAEQLLDRALSGAARPAINAGDRFAQYEIVEPIGRGGMGEVFLARRSDDLNQRVAIKIASAGLATPEANRRFLAERRILASLDHPHIARFLDAGATPAGLPWVAMEYVDGQTLNEACAARQLGIAERVALFVKVCGAVQYAHGNLVVHRDIKPANILVGAAGEPKLLDFGIAKLLAEAGEEAQTRTQFRPLTPQYASPEQVGGQPLTTATDVYSLGVVLYELLSGRLPYHAVPSQPGALERTIRETQPPSLSQAAQAAGQTRPYRKLLEGDLEVIVRTAMQKDAARRYSSPAALAEDLNRWLKGFPIMARPDSWGYRTRKFVARNPAASALGAMALLLIVAFGVTATIQARRVAAERDTANQVTAFLVSIFESADRGKTNGEAVNARQLLDRGAARVETELRGQPKAQAKLFGAIGEVYQNLGLLEPARQVFEKEVMLCRAACADDLLLASSLKRLGETYRQQAKYDPAIALAREALELSRRAGPADSQPVADSLNLVGLILNARGKPAEAEQPLREALAIKRRLYPVAGYEVAVTLQNLADNLSARGQYQAALPLLRESLEIRQRLYGDSDARSARAMHSLAMCLNSVGQLEDSEKWFRRAIGVYESLYGAEHPMTATMVNSLASVLHDGKRYDDAGSLYRRALAAQEKIQGPEGPGVAITLNNLASLHQDQGDLAGAEPLFRRSLAIRTKLYGPDSVQVARAKGNLGSLLMLARRYPQAQAILSDAVATWLRVSGTSGANLATARFNLALAIDHVQGRAASAPLAKKAIEDLRHELPAASPVLKRLESRYAKFLAEKKTP